MTESAPKTYRTILLPLDGSPLAERVLPYAATLAEASGATIVLLQVAVANLASRADAASGEVRVVDLAQEYLDGVKARFPKGVAVETAVVRGEANEAIVDASRSHHADLVVMSTHGRSGLGRWLYGSVADHVLRHVAVPVLLVSAETDRSWSNGRRRRLVVPLDGSEVALAALNPASDLTQALDAEIV
ncbi:MAG: universal stress protein, partial [Chloroflexota bacterium]